MNISRVFALVLPAATLGLVLGGATLTSRVARADVSPRVADIAAKGNISPIVPVEAGLGLGLAAGLLALGMNRRTSR